MNTLFAPKRRRRGIEVLDDPAVDPALMQRSISDVARANTLFGGRRAALAELESAFDGMRGRARMLDVGTGRGDIPAAAKKLAHDHGCRLLTIGIDASEALLGAHFNGNDLVLRGSAFELPFGDGSVDVVLASQVLHHFEGRDAIALLRELDRVAARRVVISDLRRSYIAAACLWLASFPLRFHAVSRHDGVVSVMRGFLASELADLVEEAIGQRPVVKYRLGFRVTTSWEPR